MSKYPILMCASLLFALTGCETNTTSPADEELTPEEVEAYYAKNEGKGDLIDFCQKFGWYENDRCDSFCPKPDPGCDVPFGYGEPVVKPGEERFFKRSAQKVQEIQRTVRCQKHDKDWQGSSCTIGGEDVVLKVPGEHPDRQLQCESQGGTWQDASCAQEPTSEPPRRGFHNKSHACLQAEFRILDTEESASAGPVFSNAGRTYLSWVRFSNGHPALLKDKQPDFRGLAIKLMGVDGVGSQDFLMLSNPMMAVADAEGFMHFTDHNAPPRTTTDAGLYVTRLLKGKYADDPRMKWGGYPGFEPYAEDGNPLYNPKHTADFMTHRVIGSTVKSMAETTFSSGSPIRYGNTFARYFAMPCESASGFCVDATNRGGVLSLKFKTLFERNPEALRANLLEDYLGPDGEGVRFLFHVRLHQSAGTSIENAADQWEDFESEAIPVAELIIRPRGAYDEDTLTFLDPRVQEEEAYCEGLRFNPFHAAPEYEPVGSINRVRKAVYDASQMFREAPPEEPTVANCFLPGGCENL